MPRSIKPISTRRYQKFPGKNVCLRSAPSLLCAGCAAASAHIYFRHDFSLQNRGNLLTWPRANPSPRYLRAEYTDSATDVELWHPTSGGQPAFELSCFEELLNFCWSERGILYKMQQLLRIGPRGSKPDTSPPSRWSGHPSGRFGHQSPLQRTFGFPDLSVSKRNGRSPPGHRLAARSGTFLWGGRVRSSLKGEGKNQTWGSHSLGQCPKGNITLSLPSSKIFTDTPQQLHLN